MSFSEPDRASALKGDACFIIVDVGGRAPWHASKTRRTTAVETSGWTDVAAIVLLAAFAGLVIFRIIRGGGG